MAFTPPNSGQEAKRSDVARSHHTEVSMIECRNRGLSESLCYRNDARIGATQGHVCVCAHQFGGAAPIVGCQRLDVDLAIGDRSEELCF